MPVSLRLCPVSPLLVLVSPEPLLSLKDLDQWLCLKLGMTLRRP